MTTETKSFSLDYQYSDIPISRGQSIILYKPFLVNWSWERLCVTQDNNNYYVWKDYYGSCILCDPLMNIEYEFGTNEQTQSKEVAFLDFASKYNPYATITKWASDRKEKLNNSLLWHIKVGWTITEKDCEKFYNDCIQIILNESS